MVNVIPVISHNTLPNRLCYAYASLRIFQIELRPNISNYVIEAQYHRTLTVMYGTPLLPHYIEQYSLGQFLVYSCAGFIISCQMMY